MRILVTGGTGYIGQHYVRHLVEKDPEIKVFFSGRNLDKGKRLAQLTGAHYYCGDLQDEPFINLICKDVDVVVHTAGKIGLWGDYQDFYLANVKVTERLLEAALKSGVGRLVNLATASSYFDYSDHLNVTEDFLPARFANHYARTKYQAEARVLRANSEQLRTLSLRPQLVVGAGENRFFNRLLRSHAKGQLHQVGGGRNIASLTSMGNLMQCLDCAVFGPDDVCGDVYNVADLQPLNLWDVINQMMRLAGLPKVKNRIPYNKAYFQAKLAEAWCQMSRRQEPPAQTCLEVALMGNSFSLNIERARQKLGYEPQRVMNDSLAQLAKCWQQYSS